IPWSKPRNDRNAKNIIPTSAGGQKKKGADSLTVLPFWRATSSRRTPKRPNHSHRIKAGLLFQLECPPVFTVSDLPHQARGVETLVLAGDFHVFHFLLLLIHFFAVFELFECRLRLLTVPLILVLVLVLENLCHTPRLYVAGRHVYPYRLGQGLD